MTRQLAAGLASSMVLALGVAAGDVAASPEEPALALTYDVNVYSFRAMRWQVELTRDAGAYATRFQAHVSGLPSLASDLAIHARAGGRQSDGRLRPRSYTSRLLDGDDTRSVLIAYGPDGPVMTDARPPAEEDDREAVPTDALAGTLDPLAGSYALLREVSDSGTCEGEVAMFDGRRLFRVLLRPAGDAEPGDTAASAAPDASDGETVHCRATLDKVAGFTAKERRDNRFPDELLIELAPVGPEGDLLPVRLSTEHRVGPVTITLSDARVDAEMTGAPGADALAWNWSGAR